MMSSPGTPTYDQLRIFLTVVEAGSFAAAARRLNRAVSVISYGIANLEAQLGVVLFDRAGTRRPTLTPAGRALLPEAQAVARGMDGLRAKAKGLTQGLEPELSLAVDVMWPGAWLGHALNAFSRAFPTVALRLHVEALGAVAARVIEGSAMIGLSGPLDIELDAIERIAIGTVAFVPVAAPGHPLAAGPLAPGAARAHIQLVLTDRSPLTAGRDFSVVSERTWRLADLGAKHQLLREGVGWGYMPLPLIEADLAAGTLVMLDMPDRYSQSYPFFGLHRVDSPPGPAGAWLIDRFAQGCRERGRDDPPNGIAPPT